MERERREREGGGGEDERGIEGERETDRWRDKLTDRQSHLD